MCESTGLNKFLLEKIRSAFREEALCEKVVFSLLYLYQNYNCGYSELDTVDHIISK